MIARIPADGLPNCYFFVKRERCSTTAGILPPAKRRSSAFEREKRETQQCDQYRSITPNTTQASPTVKTIMAEKPNAKVTGLTLAISIMTAIRAFPPTSRMKKSRVRRDRRGG